MLANLIAVIQALPDLIKLMSRLCDVLVRIANYAKAHELEKWVSELEASIDQLENAKTTQDKLSAAQSLALSIRSIQ